MSQRLDARVAAAAPISDAEVHALALKEAELELLAAIIGEPRTGTIPRRRRRRALTWSLAAAAACAAAVIGVLALTGSRGGSESAFAAEAVRVANAVPRLLIGEPGWKVVRADEFRVDDGEMTFAKGGKRIDLRWLAARQRDFKTRDRAASADRRSTVDVLGDEAVLFRYEGGPPHSYTALWVRGGYLLELRTSGTSRRSPVPGAGEFEHILRSLKAVGVEEWLSAMPPSVVLPVDQEKVVAKMLADIPQPGGFDARRLSSQASVRDRYQLGARVTGAVSCAWIERWVAAKRSGDTRAAAEAVAAMKTSRRWAILREMSAQGAYPEVLWDIADAMVRGGRTLGGKGPPVQDAYRSALGCDAFVP